MGCPADALVHDLFKDFPQEAVRSLSEQFRGNSPYGITSASKLLNLISHCRKYVLKLLIGSLLTPAHAQDNGRHELLGSDRNFLPGGLLRTGFLRQGRMLTFDPAHHAFIVYLFVGGMLVNDQQSFFIFDDPVGPEDLPYIFEPFGLLRCEQMFVPGSFL